MAINQKKKGLKTIADMMFNMHPCEMAGEMEIIVAKGSNTKADPPPKA